MAKKEKKKKKKIAIKNEQNFILINLKINNVVLVREPKKVKIKVKRNFNFYLIKLLLLK